MENYITYNTRITLFSHTTNKKKENLRLCTVIIVINSMYKCIVYNLKLLISRAIIDVFYELRYVYK